ncbi:MAG: carbohydrate ABC transporter permease [Defluviitaleaceae bacterium]|nr:carbohydrate ABC transporter permease [Defluviitaleaceae bacterium]
MVQRKSANIPVYIILAIAVLLISLPLYMSLIVAFKTPLENMQSFFAFPNSLYLGNFRTILSRQGYFRSLFNSFFITSLSLLGMVLLWPAAAYAIARKMGENRIYKYLYFFILLGIFIPFQVRMVPLVRLANSLGLANVNGIIVLYIAGSVAEAIFLYVAYIHTIPPDLEEAARIDGATTLHTYVRIMLPLMKPIIATVLIKDALWIWNDFMLALLMLNRSINYWTLTLFQYNFRFQFSSDPTLIMTSFVLAMIPVMVVYLFAQKHIIGGLMSGGIKA